MSNLGGGEGNSEISAEASAAEIQFHVFSRDAAPSASGLTLSLEDLAMLKKDADRHALDFNRAMAALKTAPQLPELAQMHAQSGESSLAHHATRLSENSDIFGPFSVPGVRGEKYFVALSCTYSGWSFGRCMASQAQAEPIIESLINDVCSLGELDGNVNAVEHTPVVHTG